MIDRMIEGDRPAARIQAIFEGVASQRPRDFDKELEAVLRQVNAERALLGKLPVSMADILKKEQMALGHFDYSRKLALYCEDLVLE